MSQSAQANAAVANENTNATDMRTRADDIESLRTQLTIALSKVVAERHNVRMGLEKIRRKDAQLCYLRKEYVTALKWTLQMTNETLQVTHELREKTNALQMLRAEKEAEIQELKVQKQAELQKLRVEKEAEIQELKVQKQAELQKVKVHKEAEVQKVMKENIRLLCIVDKEEARLQAMSEHCKLLALKHHN